MIPRFTRPEMKELWSELNKKKSWHKVEVAVLRARFLLKMIPEKIPMNAAKVVITPEILLRADELESLGDHDLIAFVLAVSEKLDELTRIYYHTGLTSFDIEDTALALLLVHAMEILIGDVKCLRAIIYVRAKQHKNTQMIGRTHFIHAEPITFGLMLLNWVDVLDRHLEYMEYVKEDVRVGKISGAVGKYSLDPLIEEATCKLLGLKAAKISTQIINRDRITRYVNCLVGVANSLEKFATDIRLLAGTDVGEVTEFKKETAKGSSAMPGKSFLRNPIKDENICGCARVMRGYGTMANQNENLWLGRSLDNSAAERIFLPDATTLLDFTINRSCEVMEKLEVYPEQMDRNLCKTGGIVYAQQVMIALTDKGMPRDVAYDLLEGLAKSVKRGVFVDSNRKDFEQLVLEHHDIKKLLTYDEIKACFNPNNSLKHVETIFQRFK